MRLTLRRSIVRLPKSCFLEQLCQLNELNL